MRSGLFNMGFSMKDVVTILRIFDKNLNGSIEMNEFLSIFTGKPIISEGILPFRYEKLTLYFI